MIKNIAVLFLTLIFLSCSSDDATSVRRITFKADGAYKMFEDIKVQTYTDNNFDVPFTRLQITASPKDGAPETFSVVVNRGGDFDEQSRNGGAFLNEKGYDYNFDHPLEMHLTINTTKRIKGTFEGIYTTQDGEDIHFTDGTIDITYLPDNPYYIKH